MGADLSWFHPLPTQDEFIRWMGKECVYAGGVGCISAETLIHDPVLGSNTPVSEIDGPGYVWALDGDRPVVALRTRPVRKGRAELFRFTTDAGTIVATADHRFLTPEGWKRGGDLSCGELLLVSPPAPPATIEEHAPSTRRAGDRCCARTTPGSRCGCHPERHSGDAPLLAVGALSRDDAPSRGGALGCSRDGLGAERARSRSCPPIAPSDRTGSPRAGALLRLRLDGVPPLASVCAEHARPSNRGLRQLGSRTDLLGTDGRLLQGRAALLADAPECLGDDARRGRTPLASLSCPHPTPLREKTSIGVGEFWDLHVPGYENYWAAGTWHHNSGKTLSGSFKAVVLAHQFPGTVGLVGRQSYRALQDTTKRVMVYGDDKPPVLHPDLVESFSEADEEWILRCGSRIMFRSLEDHNIEKLLSLNLGWFYVDEMTETTEKVWLALMSRLRHPVGPRICWGTTNPNGHDWVWRRFHPDANPDLKGRRLFIQPTHANRRHLAPDYIEMLESMPKEWQKRFVYASFDQAAGMIWDNWQRDIHVYEHDVVGFLPPTWKRFEAMDYGRRNPTAWLWFAVDFDGNLIVEDEYYVAGLVASEHAKAIRVKRQMIAPGIKYGAVIAPPDCFRADINGSTVEREFFEHAGIPMLPANDNVDAGLIRVSEWLRRDPDHVFPDWHPYAGTKGPDELGAPRLFVSSRCRNLIAEIPDYRWQDLSPAMEEKKDQPEAPRKLNDHACFVAGTLVGTERGDVPIEDLRIGDLVWTRSGLRPVTALAITGFDEPLATLLLEDGRSLIATPDHKVWIEGRGFVRLDEVRYGDKCLASANVALPPKPRDDRPGSSGPRRTGRSRVGTTSTTETATRSTTTWRISSACRLEITNGITERLRRRKYARLVDSACSTWQSLLRQHGIAQQRVAPGIPSTPVGSGSIASLSAARASSAEQSTTLSSPTATGSALTAASRHGDAPQDWTTSEERAWCAAAPSRSTSTSRPEPVLAPALVRSVLLPGEDGPRGVVYNLTVADRHELLANGILARQCDALRYGVMSRARPVQQRRPEDHREAPDRASVGRSAFTAGLISRQF